MPSQRTRATAGATSSEAEPPSTDELASRMTSRLRISKEKGKEKDTGVRAPPTRIPAKTRAKKQVADGEAEALADIVAEKLTIREPAAPKERSIEEVRAEAMRAVNAASKNLSAIVETGWKSSDPTGPPRSNKPAKAGSSKTDATTSQVQSCVEAIREGLAALRKARPGDVDVERAACSAAGKLVSLESVSASVTHLEHVESLH